MNSRPGAQRDAKGGEVAGADLVVPRVDVHVGPGRKPLYVDVRPPFASRQERNHRTGRAAHTGDRAHLVLHPTIEQQGAGAVVSAPIRRDAERDHVVDVHTKIHPRHVDQALQEEACGDEQRGGQGDLDRHEGRPEPGGASCPRDLAGVGANRRDQLRARAVPSREHAERDPRGEPQRAGEDQHHGLETEPDRAHDFGRSEGGDPSQSPVGHEQTGERAQAGEEHGFGEQLGDELPAAGAQGQTDAHLHATARATHEQEIRDVGARDEQHDRGDAEQHEQRRLRVPVHRALSPRARGEDDPLDPELGHELLAHALLERRLDFCENGMVDRVEPDVGLCQGHTRL